MIDALRREYRSLPPPYWTLWVGTLINKAGGFVVPFLALYITARGGSESDAGVIMALYGGGYILAGLTGGLLADRVGRRATLLLSLLGGAAAMLSIGLSRSLTAIGATTFLMGWLAELYRPAVSAAVADLVGPADRQRAYANLYWVVNLGFAIAPVLAGLVASRSYLALFAVDAATMAGYGLLVALRVPETRPAAGAAPASGAPAAGLDAVLRDRVFGGFLVLTLGLAVVMWQSGTALPLDMQRHGISPRSYGLIMAVNGAMIVLLQPPLTRALARFRRTSVIAGASLLFGVGFGLYGVVSTGAGYALATAVWTLGEIACLPSMSAVVADLAPTALRGRYQGLYAMVWGVASRRRGAAGPGRRTGALVRVPGDDDRGHRRAPGPGPGARAPRAARTQLRVGEGGDLSRGPSRTGCGHAQGSRGGRFPGRAPRGRGAAGSGRTFRDAHPSGGCAADFPLQRGVRVPLDPLRTLPRRLGGAAGVARHRRARRSDPGCLRR